MIMVQGGLACDPPKKEPPPVVEGTTEPTIAEIREWLKRTRQLELKMVDCPVSIPVEKGYNFTCRAIAQDDSAANVTVEIVNRNGETKMTLEHPIVVAAEIEASLVAEGAKKVSCGPRIRRAKPGETVACTVDGDARELSVGPDGRLP
jgi:hypothetical protein